jgi:hypothetical protein
MNIQLGTFPRDVPGGPALRDRRSMTRFNLLVDLLRIDYGQVRCVVLRGRRYLFGMARSVWIASPVSHANPVVTAAR